jgi:hypothetical protein
MPQSVHTLMMSDEFFELVAGAVHIHSLATRRLESINTTIHLAATIAVESPLPDKAVRALLEGAELSGPTKLHMIVRDRWYPTFKAAWSHHAEAAGRTLLVKECVYLLLAQFVVYGPRP